MDPGGQTVASASIQIISPQQSVVAVTKSSSDGSFELPDLPSGDYEVRIAAPGFESATLPIRMPLARDLVVELRVQGLRTEISVTVQRGMTFSSD